MIEHVWNEPSVEKCFVEKDREMYTVLVDWTEMLAQMYKRRAVLFDFCFVLLK